ncbi:MAG TPA: ATP-binding protein, partial [Blastocatellia bacterium]|nr:ATP-binding protein [Blastocatellia bacterium]
MKDLGSKIKLTAALAVIVGLVAIGVLNLRDRLSLPAIPSDGITWVDTPNGVQAKRVAPDSPLSMLVQKGDYVRDVFYHKRYEEVARAETISRYLDNIGVDGRARYAVEHPDNVLAHIYGISRPLYDCEFKVRAMPDDLAWGLYLALIGVVYLAIGVFVLFKQGRATLTYHFLGWFVVSFVVYFYHYTKEFTPLDNVVDFLHTAAFALLAPLFLHFCARFPSRVLKGRIKFLLWAAYIPAAALALLEALYHYRSRSFAPRSLELIRGTLDWVEIGQYAVYFVIGGALLTWSFVRARTPILRQQLKWIIWGLGMSVVPFTVFYFTPLISGLEITPAMNAAGCLPLILIPLSFGYSIVRYRLMDVDVIMRRSFVHMAAVIAVGAMYMALLLAVGDMVKFVWPTADLNSWSVRAVVVAGMLIVAVLFAPIRDRLQIWADRWFYGERYTLRTGIQEFGRMLAQTTALPSLLDSIARRLAELLSVPNVAIFIEDGEAPSGFRLAHTIGCSGRGSLRDGIKGLIQARSLGRGFISTYDLGDVEAQKQPQDGLTHASVTESSELISQRSTGGSAARSVDGSGYQELGPAPTDLYYYVPCVVRDRMVAVIGLGRPASGALLTTEDTSLLRALSGYVAVAIDNSLLYRSEMEKAEELARLKEFSENIIESVSVGMVVVGLDGRITTWNSAMERMFQITREQALNCDAVSVLGSDLVETIRRVIGRREWDLDYVRQIYKYALTPANGECLTLNILLSPFEAARGVTAGLLMVVENVTERVGLEQQLMEREKLSSIGLLAAGVAHEVNTPLAGISSYSQMLLQQIPENDPKHQLLAKIQAQTMRASGIVSNLLNFSRTGDARFAEIDINKVLDDTLQLLEPQLRNTSVEIVRHYTQGLPAGYGNASKLQQVFMNMILNARDAMPGGGRLDIHSRSVEGALVVDFKDTGVGIAPENIARIYDPFFTTKEVGQGTGLGLALSYGIVQEHGGRIFVESRPGEGAHFTI